MIRSYGRREKFGDGLLVPNVQTRGKTELILPVKMETRHPVEGQFGSSIASL